MKKLYKKSTSEILDLELFKNPTSEYRAAPFWSWNNKLPIDEMKRQIDCFKDMGFGGFHAHCRTGLDTEYLGEHFMDAVDACNEKAKENGMYLYLYDEDGYSSGFAGGSLTKDPVHRGRRIFFTTVKRDNIFDEKTAIQNGGVYLVAAFDIMQDENGYLKHYTTVDPDTSVASGHTRWYAYCETHVLCEWYNGYTYCDTLRKETVDRFCEMTLTPYNTRIGKDFGGSVPSIFTDEPLALRFVKLSSSFDKDGAVMQWTPDFDETFSASYGFCIIEKIPELFFELPQSAPSKARYLFHRHVLDRFSENFSDNYGQNAKKFGLRLTGHLFGEGTLYGQSIASGECMRNYQGFDIPGVDILCNEISLSTLKQTQSVVHQLEKDGMMSELYGVTGWNFDFRGHKFQGDWQAALGVTLRVPHLAWLSMKGANKRDYPAPIGPQSPWYKEYKYVEDHFARLNTVLTRGRPIVNICMIHPVETAWVLAGPDDLTGAERQKCDETFTCITEKLSFNGLDFDYVSESLLPESGSIDSGKFKVGKMSYDVVLVPTCVSMRSTTLELLESFCNNGGKVIFFDKMPTVCDGELSDRVKSLYDRAFKVDRDLDRLVSELEQVREVAIKRPSGETPEYFVHTLREDTDCRWLFLAHAKHIDDSVCDELYVTVNGEYNPEIYDTVSGEIRPVTYEVSSGKTVIKTSLCNADSLLLRLGKPTEKSNVANTDKRAAVKTHTVPDKVEYLRDEPNCLILDYAVCQLDNGEPKEQNVMMFDRDIRAKLGYKHPNGTGRHPWTIPDKEPEHTATLIYTFESEYECTAALACEQAISAELNGESVDLTPCGYYVDADILKTDKVLKLKKGTNTLRLKVGVGEKYLLENCFILGEFDVEVSGRHLKIKRPSEIIGFVNIAENGMPFYGGNITYKFSVNTPDCELKITVPQYKGAVIKVSVDKQEQGMIAYAPYSLNVKGISAGEHTIELTLFGHRENTFGRVLHNTADRKWYGMNEWHPAPEDFSDNYRNVPIGILKAPKIEIF